MIATAQLGRFTDCNPETGSTGHPQERQHGGAAFAAGAGPSAPGEGHDVDAAAIVTRMGRDARKGGAWLSRAEATVQFPIARLSISEIASFSIFSCLGEYHGFS